MVDDEEKKICLVRILICIKFGHAPRSSECARLIAYIVTAVILKQCMKNSKIFCPPSRCKGLVTNFKTSDNLKFCN